MRYLRCFKFSNEVVKNPNLYPYHVLKDKTGELLEFDGITMIYGENGSGKSSFLNLLACKMNLTGAEKAKPPMMAKVDYFQRYLDECLISFETGEDEQRLNKPAPCSRYIKSEDILYEIKKIQQEAVLREGYLYHRRQLGMTKKEAVAYQHSDEMNVQISRQLFGQEKYSNGETALQVFEDYLLPDAIYLLDEPEASLSPAKQLELAAFIQQSARLLSCQFVIATHSPLILGSLEGKIYNFTKPGLVTEDWRNLPEIQLYANFFKEKFFSREGS